MSGIIGTVAISAFGSPMFNDDSLQPADYKIAPPNALPGPLPDADVLWPRSRWQGGIVWDAMSLYYENDFWSSGQHRRKQVSGTVINSQNAGVPGATVLLFNTTANLLVDTQTTAADGSYSCGDPNAVQCFAVAYLPGAPDTAGTTIDELTGV